MIGILIAGLLGGLVFFLFGKLSNKVEYGIRKGVNDKKVLKAQSNIANGNIRKEDLVCLINYHGNKREQNEGEKYIHISQKHFPKDRVLNETIFVFYKDLGVFDIALNKIESLLEETPENADILFYKGLCLYKLGEKELAEVYRLKAGKKVKFYLKTNYTSENI